MKKAAVDLLVNTLALMVIPLIIYEQMVVRAKNALGRYQKQVLTKMEALRYKAYRGRFYKWVL